MLREENRMDGDCVVGLYWLEDFGEYARRIGSVICAISVGRIAPQWKGVGGEIVWLPFNVRSAVVCACCVCCQRVPVSGYA